MCKYFSDSLQGLLDDVDAWFFNYFTLENFDTANDIECKIINLINGQDIDLFNECKRVLINYYEWPLEYVEQNYEDILNQLKQTGTNFLTHLYH